jgi:hypothetical protein
MNATTPASPNRLALEKAMSENADKKWTKKEMKTVVPNPKHIDNYLKTMQSNGSIRLIEQDSAGHNVWVWHTSKHAHAKKREADVAGPREYCNGAMPNGDADYWRKALAWGR